MDWCDAETIRKTINSWQHAVDSLLTICPKIEPDVNDYNSKNPAPCSWRLVCGARDDFLREHASGIFTHQAELFEYGRPRDHTPQSWVWRSSFLKMSFVITRPFHMYGWRAGSMGRTAGVNEDGSPYDAIPAKPAKIDSLKRHVTLRFDGQSFGLADWYIKHEEILAVCDECTAEVRDKYLAAVEKADEDVRKWQEARAALVVIPVAESALDGDRSWENRRALAAQSPRPRAGGK